MPKTRSSIYNHLGRILQRQLFSAPPSSPSDNSKDAHWLWTDEGIESILRRNATTGSARGASPRKGFLMIRPPVPSTRVTIGSWPNNATLLDCRGVLAEAIRHAVQLDPGCPSFSFSLSLFPFFLFLIQTNHLPALTYRREEYQDAVSTGGSHTLLHAYCVPQRVAPSTS
jgi:hypothetical protein